MAGDQRRDISLSENYGRSKRAAMLYSAGLVILGFAVSKGSGVNVSWLGMEIPLLLAKLFTWAASLYYAIIFWFEWRIARLINSRAIDNEAGTAVNSRLFELSKTIENYSDEIGQVSNSYISAVAGVTGNIAQFLENADEMKRRLSEEPAFRNNEYADMKVVKAAAERLTTLGSTLKLDIEIVKSRSRECLETNEKISDALAAINADFSTLSSRFVTEQKIQFYLLDLGVVIFLFGVGTIFLMVAVWPILRALL